MTWLSIISFTFSTLLALTFVDVDGIEQDRTGQDRIEQRGTSGKRMDAGRPFILIYLRRIFLLHFLFCSAPNLRLLLFSFFFFFLLLFLLIVLSLSLPPTPQSLFSSLPLSSSPFLFLFFTFPIPSHPIPSHPIPEPNLKPQNGGQVSPTRPSSDSIRRVGRQHRTGRSSSRCGIFSFELGLEV